MSSLSRKELQDIAWLARLELTDAELDRFEQQTKAVLNYIAALSHVQLPPSESDLGCRAGCHAAQATRNHARNDTSESKLQENLKITCMHTHNNTRPDELQAPQEAHNTEQLLVNAPQKENNYFVVPHMLSHT